jgi:hypothetical protein
VNHLNRTRGPFLLDIPARRFELKAYEPQLLRYCWACGLSIFALQTLKHSHSRDLKDSFFETMVRCVGRNTQRRWSKVGYWPRWSVSAMGWKNCFRRLAAGFFFP